ncbi:MAG: type II toxin-antitoxin system RelE/ParE family toxin [Actinomycetota bacterium]|nr:type II toxin-antitoxin system RelE/ParE family toxin [Actinomycetota bacterium]
MQIHLQSRAVQRLENLLSSDNQIDVLQGEALSSAVDGLARTPRPFEATLLQSADRTNDRQLWNLLVGRYRIVYEIRDDLDRLTILDFRTGVS